MRERRHGPSRFWLGLLIYILIFSLLAVAALLVLHSYLDAYEKSRPGTALRSYISECVNGKLGYGWGKSLAELDSRMMDEKEAQDWAREKLKSATIHELPGTGEGEKRYVLRDEDGVSFLTVTLRAGEEGRWGFTGWEVADEVCDLTAYTHSAEALVPEGYTVRVDGVEPLVPKVGEVLSLGAEDAPKVTYLSEILDQLLARNMWSDVTVIDMSDIASPAFAYLGRFTVRLGQDENVEYKFGMLQSAVEQLAEQDAGTIDLSIDKKVHFSPG